MNETEPSAFSTALPPLPLPTEAMRSTCPSASVSLPSSRTALKRIDTSSVDASVSGSATGTSFTGATRTLTGVSALVAVPSEAT